MGRHDGRGINDLGILVEAHEKETSSRTVQMAQPAIVHTEEIAISTILYQERSRMARLC